MENPLVGFDEFWSVFPRKVAKGAAKRMYQKAVKGAKPEEILCGAQRYASERAGNDPKFTKHPATWLHGECWTDEALQQGIERDGRSVLAAADRFIEHFGGPEAARAYVPGSAGPAPLSLDYGPSAAGVRLLPKG